MSAGACRPGHRTHRIARRRWHEHHAAFPPTLAAAQARVAAIRPAAYARSRNALGGAVSRLSPYLTHGFIDPPDVLATVAARHPIGVQHKFVFELGWREYFQHVARHRGDGILDSLHPGPLPDPAYASALPVDIRTARTGLPVVDQAVRTLYAEGYLHNHARMWLASYVVHLRKVHWRAGADWMLAHLLDGDLASNHLSWQWIVGTASRKPYLFNADNVARYAPADWHSPDSVLDTDHATLEAIARQPAAVAGTPIGIGVDEPLLDARPAQAHPPDPADVAGRDVWLVHPWALADPPRDLPAGTACIGWWPASWHARWPWSRARWRFVESRMAELAACRWRVGGAELAEALSLARSVHTLAHPQVAAELPARVQARPPRRLFAEIDVPCASFSAWWQRVTRGVTRLADLPGMSTATPHHVPPPEPGRGEPRHPEPDPREAHA